MIIPAISCVQGTRTFSTECSCMRALPFMFLHPTPQPYCFTFYFDLLVRLHISGNHPLPAVPEMVMPVVARWLGPNLLLYANGI